MRLSKDEYYLNIALAVSKRSSCLKRQYGCIIVKNDKIVATGYNGAPKGEINCCDLGKCSRLHKANNSGDYSDCYAVHAEQNAIMSANREDLVGATLYLAGTEPVNYRYEGAKIVDIDVRRIDNPKPCPICSRIIKNSGIIDIIVNA